MSKVIANVATLYDSNFAGELKVELVRKGLHILIALVPMIASFNRSLALAILVFGTLSYVIAEQARRDGYTVFLISRLTMSASRDRDKDHFVLGPVTLGMGAMLALLFYPHAAASIAIYALAFGDSFSSLFGKLMGKARLPFSGEKTYLGSTACFIVVYITTYYLIQNAGASLIIAAAATFFEALPARDFDNIIVPLGTGLVATHLLPLL